MTSSTPRPSASLALALALALAMGPALARADDGPRAGRTPTSAAADAAQSGAKPAAKPTAKSATSSSRAADERAHEALERAYRKELVYLEGQKRALVERREKLGARHDETRLALERAIAETESATLATELASDRIEDELERAEMALGALADAADVEANVREQALALLGAGGVVGHDPATTNGAIADDVAPSDGIAALERALLATVARLAARHEVTSEDSAFFDESGKRRAGRVISLGSIARFGVAADDPSVAGPLAPLGGGDFKLASRAPDDVRTLVSGSAKRLTLFLYESPDKAVVEAKEKTIEDIIDAGGAIGLVIIGLGIMAFFFAIARALTLVVIGWRRTSFIDAVVASLERGDRALAASRCQRRGGPLGRVLGASVRSLALPREAREDAVDEAILATSHHIDRFGTVVLVSAAVAPLLGLLGTVTGMIATFDSITTFGTGDPRLLSGGISEALVTTELGLLVAIPALLLGNLTGAFAERIHKDVERGALLVLNLADAPVAVSHGPRPEAHAAPAAALRPGDETTEVSGEWGIA